MTVKQPRLEVVHLPPSSAEVKNEWSCTSLPPVTFMAWIGPTLTLLLIDIRDKLFTIVHYTHFICSLCTQNVAKFRSTTSVFIITKKKGTK
jgi:hypothetical protein